MELVSEIHDDEIGLFSTAVVFMGCIFSMIRSKMAEWTIEASQKLSNDSSTMIAKDQESPSVLPSSVLFTCQAHNTSAR